MYTIRILLIMLFSILLSGSVTTNASRSDKSPMYSITDLGRVYHNLHCTLSINSSGVVVGAIETEGSPLRAVCWTNQRQKSLGTLWMSTGSDHRWLGTSSGLGINKAGWIVGFSQTKGEENFDTIYGPTHAFLYQNGRVKDLTDFDKDNDVWSYACGINDKGQIVGRIRTGDQQDRACLWTNGKVIDLGTLDGKSSAAYAINNQGQVVGIADDQHENSHAALWQQGKIVDLGTLGGKESEAHALNDAGQIVGTAMCSAKHGKVSHAFLWDHGKMRDLGTLSDTDSEAPGINDHQDIVGRVYSERNSVGHAFVYRSHAQYDLNDLIPAHSGWTLTSAEAINNNGEIVGFGDFKGYRHIYLLHRLSAYR